MPNPFISRNPFGITKPPTGGLIDYNHPFMKDMLMMLLFDGAGTFPLWRNIGWDVGGGASFGGPTIYTGGITRPRVASLGTVGISDAGWRSNSEGLALSLDTSFTNVDLGEASFLPTTAVTVLVIRRLTSNTALGDGALFSAETGGGGFYGFAPDRASGNTYWRFGSDVLQGNTGLDTSLLVDRLIFIAGPLGMRVWQNGVKVLTNATVGSRTAASTNLTLGAYAAGTVLGPTSQEINYFHIINAAWPDEMCRWWSAQPYDHLYYGSGASRSFGDVTEIAVAPQWRSALVHSAAVSELWEASTVNNTGITALNAAGMDFGSTLAQDTKTTKWFAFKAEGEILVSSLDPTVDAGPNQSVDAFLTATLAGSGTAGSYPCAAGTPTYLWTQVLGPTGGTATFVDATDPTTDVDFDVSGLYQLRLTASNGLDSVSDDVIITVVNAPPMVNAGPDQEVLQSDVVQLAGSATDDGLPIPPATLTTTWTKANGPGTVTFDDDSDPLTTVEFSVAGIYVLMLEGFDGEKSTFDSVTITVLGGDTGNCVLPGPDPVFDCE